MNLEIEKNHCTEKKWYWTLALIKRFEKEIESLKEENKKLKEQAKAHRLYNSCNY